MSLLNAKDNEVRSYLEIADALRQHGSQVTFDLRALWRRIVFSVLISNTDDHLRNHAFLYTGPGGWRLAPAYDLNPVPIEIKPRVLTTAIDLDDTTASIDLALQVAAYFEVDHADAKEIIAHVGKTTAQWRMEAKSLDLTHHEIDAMSSAFEHEDLKAALKP